MAELPPYEPDRPQVGLQPTPMDADELVTVLTDMARRVQLGDSFGGSIEYDALEAPKGADFLVRGVYRVGNSMGQGGTRMIGEMPT